MKQIKFDVDGVLARFTTGACKIHGRPTDETPIYTTWNHHYTWGIKDEAFYAPMGKAFWRDLPVWDDGMQLLRLVEAMVGRDAISFLSAPVRTAGCEEGKRAWFAATLPQYDPWADLFLGGAKHKHAHADGILVDDSESNCQKWEKADGIAILVPRPWNAFRDLCDENGSFHVGYVQDQIGRLL